MPMRQLRACDFCGDDAAGVYEVLPSELSPTEAEQRRVVLCENCLETLETVVDPLLDRLGIGGDADAEPTAKPRERAGESAARPTARPGDEVAAASDSAPGSTSDTGRGGADRAASDSDAQTTDDSSRRSSGSGNPSAFNAPAGFTDIAESDEIDLGGSPDGSPSDSDANGVADASPSSGSPDSRDGTRRERAAGDTSEESLDDDTAAPEAPDREDTLGSGRNAVGAEPDDFRTVMRLLGNREFPIERTEVVDLAAGAYDLDETHVERIVDHAIDRGVLDDEDGTLRRS